MSAGQAVGQVEVIINGYVDGVRIELVPISEALEFSPRSRSWIYFMADTGQIIATKYHGIWLVDKRLIKVKDYFPVLDG